MKFPHIDQNNIYVSMVGGIPGDVPGSFYSPEGVSVSALGEPPTDEPGKWRDNGVEWVEVTAEELTAFEYTTALSESAAILTAKMQRQLVQAETFTATEFAVFAKAGLFPAWAPGEAYVTGDRFVREGVVYEVQQAVTAQAHQTPRSAGMLAVYRPISADPDTGAEPDGSRENPYSFIYGMDVSTSKYYIFKGKLYLAKADMIPCVWAPNSLGLWQWELVE